MLPHAPSDLPLSRRRFVVASIAGLAIAPSLALAQPSRRSRNPRNQEPTPPPAAPAGPTYYTWTPLSDRAILGSGDGGNTVLLRAGDAAALIDAKMPHTALTLRREAEAHGAKISLLINTHHHLDHAGGNLAFTPDCKVIAHANAKPRIEAQLERNLSYVKNGLSHLERAEGEHNDLARPDVEALLERVDALKAADWAPTETFSGRLGASNLALLPIDLHHVGPGHTDNDVIVHAPQLDLVHMGDLVFHDLHPFIDRAAGASVDGWIKSLKYAKRLCRPKTVVIPGHGEPTDQKGLDAMIEYLEKTRDFVASQRRQKKTRDEIKAMTVPGTESRGYQHLRPMVLEAVYDELAG